MADPGFPVGGRQPRRGGANSQGGYVSKNLYVKMKESGPLGGCTPVAPPGSANASIKNYFLFLQAQAFSGNICRSLVCHDPKGDKCYILGDTPAYMGTTCGHKKVSNFILFTTL